MTRAKRFVDEALALIGEAEEDTLNKDVDPNVIDATKDDELDLGATGEEPPVEDEFGLGGDSTTAPTVRIEKEGPITVNKGDVQLSIGDDGSIDITLDGAGGATEPDLSLGDMTDTAPEGEGDKEASAEEDDYKIDWDKEKEKEVPKEGLSEDPTDVKEPIHEGTSKAAKVLEMHKVVTVTECTDKKYECMSCENYNECKDKHKKAEPEEEKDFLSQGYL
jgi:hypothetical protein